MDSTRSLSALLHALSRLAAPVAVARLGIMGMGITDTIVVGQLAPAELPALALGWAPTGVLLVGGIGLLMGVQVLTAQAVGEQRSAEAGAIWRRGLVLAAVAGAAGAVGLAAWIVFSATGRRHGVRRHASGPSYHALLAVGAAAAVSQLAEAGAFSLMTVIAGRIGATAVATYQLLLNLLAVVFMLSLGS